jgi:hypothetical protein
MIPHTRYHVKQNTTSVFNTLEAEEAKMLVLPFRYVKYHLHWTVGRAGQLGALSICDRTKMDKGTCKSGFEIECGCMHVVL